MNMADQERLRHVAATRPAPIFTPLNPLEALSASLEAQGYFAKLSKIPRAWQCMLFRDGATNETPPTGRGETALEALQAAAAQIGRNT